MVSRFESSMAPSSYDASSVFDIHDPALERTAILARHLFPLADFKVDSLQPVPVVGNTAPQQNQKNTSKAPTSTQKAPPKSSAPNRAQPNKAPPAPAKAQSRPNPAPQKTAPPSPPRPAPQPAPIPKHVQLTQQMQKIEANSAAIGKLLSSAAASMPQPPPQAPPRGAPTFTQPTPAPSFQKPPQQNFSNMAAPAPRLNPTTPVSSFTPPSPTDHILNSRVQSIQIPTPQASAAPKQIASLPQVPPSSVSNASPIPNSSAAQPFEAKNAEVVKTTVPPHAHPNKESVPVSKASAQPEEKGILKQTAEVVKQPEAAATPTPPNSPPADKVSLGQKIESFLKVPSPPPGFEVKMPFGPGSEQEKLVKHIASEVLHEVEDRVAPIIQLGTAGINQIRKAINPEAQPLTYPSSEVHKKIDEVMETDLAGRYSEETKELRQKLGLNKTTLEAPLSIGLLKDAGKVATVVKAAQAVEKTLVKEEAKLVGKAASVVEKSAAETRVGVAAGQVLKEEVKAGAQSKQGIGQAEKLVTNSEAVAKSAQRVTTKEATQAATNVEIRSGSIALKEQVAAIRVQPSGIWEIEGKSIKTFDSSIFSDKNKLSHVFKDSRHQLNRLGSDAQTAFEKVTKAVIEVDRAGGIPANQPFVTRIKIDGNVVEVRGIVNNGELQIGTFFVPEG